MNRLVPIGQASTVQLRYLTRSTWLVIAAALILAALAGYLLGLNRSNVTILTCPAYVAPTQATASCADGRSYAIPVESIEWRDATGGVHLDGRPACIPLGPQQLGRVTFATVDVRADAVTRRPVLWVNC
jgi:hypothetical protein